ncbi:MAG TPA: hypothetical protein DCP28_15855, partial [Cytophagales bacterium]|nr:hypothetical protein [Cytophagales bacterium]
HSSITWRVHVANIKAAWYQFNNAMDLGDFALPAEPRNPNAPDRSQLVIDPGSRTISGKGEEGTDYQFDTGRWNGKEVWLGELKTDKKGRLIFIGGDGHSASVNNEPAITFANNNDWHDDTSDGVVRAKVTIDGKHFEAEPAMVAVTPPDFGPGLYGVVTMNDVVEDLFIRNDKFDYEDPAKDGVNFWRDIAPMLVRMTTTGWVNEGFYMLFGHNSPSDFTSSELMDKLSDPSDEHKALRKKVFRWFRDPASIEWKPAKVPPLYGDGFGEYEQIFLDDLPITHTMYDRLRKWAKGKFSNQPILEPRSFEELSLEEQLTALNQAPLEECLGGPFHPGIELTWPMRVPLLW